MTSIRIARLAFLLVLGPIPPTSAQSITDQEAYEIAKDAYIYAYPLVLQDLTSQQVTNVAEPKFPNAPLNQFSHAQAFPPADMKIVVRPNADTSTRPQT
jgi:hypothetical protein